MWSDYLRAMTSQVNIAEAKAKLSALVKAAEAGEEVILTRDSVPVVRLVAMTPAPGTKRRLGIWKEYGWSGPPPPYEAFEPDPKDAILEDMTVVTRDPAIAALGARTVW
jgi:prevent-host-death family protein